MLRVESDHLLLEGPAGLIVVPPDDEIVLKLSMLFEGQCEGLGATAAAEKFGFSRQRYYQLLAVLHAAGAEALKNAKRGPKTLYRRTDEVQRQVIRHRFLDPAAIERQARQLLSDKVSGTHVGVWLLMPELPRLGVWDLLQGWTGQPAEPAEPRLALQLVHKAAPCVNGLRQRRCLSQKGFELANGLPFVAADQAIHDLLDAHTVQDAQHLQIGLGMLRRASGHFIGQALAIPPHALLFQTPDAPAQRPPRRLHRQCGKSGGCSPKGNHILAPPRAHSRTAAIADYARKRPTWSRCVPIGPKSGQTLRRLGQRGTI